MTRLMCPLTREKCVEEGCAFWVERANQCAVNVIGFTLNSGEVSAVITTKIHDPLLVVMKE